MKFKKSKIKNFFTKVGTPIMTAAQLFRIAENCDSLPNYIFASNSNCFIGLDPRLTEVEFKAKVLKPTLKRFYKFLSKTAHEKSKLKVD